MKNASTTNTEVKICICGKKTRIKKNGIMGETCGNRSCAGKRARKAMEMVRGFPANADLFVKVMDAKTEYNTRKEYWGD